MLLPISVTFPGHFILLVSITHTKQKLKRSTNHKAPHYAMLFVLLLLRPYLAPIFFYELYKYFRIPSASIILSMKKKKNPWP